jgi:hypothetical protein
LRGCGKTKLVSEIRSEACARQTRLIETTGYIPTVVEAGPVVRAEVVELCLAVVEWLAGAEVVLFEAAVV